jgi:hypothetical protein
MLIVQVDARLGRRKKKKSTYPCGILQWVPSLTHSPWEGFLCGCPDLILGERTSYTGLENDKNCRTTTITTTGIVCSTISSARRQER